MHVPKVMGPDGVSTVAYGEQGFFGTSAAAPHVAGLTALMLEKNSWTPEQVTYGVQEFSQKESVNLASSFDSSYGYGTADAFFLTKETSVIEITNSNLEFEEGTVRSQENEDNDTDIIQQDIDPGGCLIATATFGTELAPQVQMLRELRDNTLLQTSSGSMFMTEFNSIYYTFSPGIADLERQNPAFKEIVKIAITPLVSSLLILNYVDMDTESKVLGYGIGVILLNIAMYFTVPAIILWKLKSRIKEADIENY